MKFNYTNNVKTLQSIHIAFDSRVDVVGDPGNASYEWVYVDAELGKTIHSDCGYGNPEVALRDGLIAALGLPEHNVLEGVKS